MDSSTRYRLCSRPRRKDLLKRVGRSWGTPQVAVEAMEISILISGGLFLGGGEGGVGGGASDQQHETTPVPQSVPTAPANLTAQAAVSGFTSATIGLTWTENPASAVTGFIIQRTTSPAFTTGVTTSTAGPAARTYTLAGLRRRTRYYIRIESVNGPAASGWTTAAVTTP